MTDELANLVLTIKEIANPGKIILFGSRVRQPNRQDSDYDFLIIKKNATRTRKLAQKLYFQVTNISAPIDFVVVDEKKFHEHIDNPYFIYRNAAREGQVLYER